MHTTGVSATAFAFKNLLRHYAKLTPNHGKQVDVKFGRQCKSHKGQSALRIFAIYPVCPFQPGV